MEGLIKSYEPFLEEIWSEYGFPGHPPFKDSVAENRLKEACDKYANFIDHYDKGLPGDEKHSKGVKGISSSETDRRNLHNQIAVMVFGRLRSGMEEELARHIAEFAYEFSRGYKIGEKEKYKR